MAIFNSYVKLPEGTLTQPKASSFRLRTWEASSHQHRCWNDQKTVHGGPPAAVFHEAPSLPISSTSQNYYRHLPWVFQGLPRIHCIILCYSILYSILYYSILYYIYIIIILYYAILYHIISYHIIYIVSTASILEANLPHTFKSI